MKYLVLLSLFLVACTPRVEQDNYAEKGIVPEELKDCRYYELFSGGIAYKGWKCPHSTTTTNYKSGKSNQTLVFVD